MTKGVAGLLLCQHLLPKDTNLPVTQTSNMQNLILTLFLGSVGSIQACVLKEAITTMIYQYFVQATHKMQPMHADFLEKTIQLLLLRPLYNVSQSNCRNLLLNGSFLFRDVLIGSFISGTSFYN